MLKNLDKEQEAAVAATMQSIQDELDADRRAAARKAKARQLIMPTEEEDAAITAAALSDPDNPPLTDEQLAQLKPARRRPGRPAQEVRKALTSIRLDMRVLDAFKATGDGWQTRMNDALLEYASQHGMLT